MDESEILKSLQIERQNAHEAQIMNEALVASIGDGIVIVNEYGIITKINQAAMDLLGYRRDEMEGVWLPKVLPSKDKNGNEIPTYDRPVVRSLLTGQTTTEIMTYVRKDGSVFPVQSIASPFMVQDNPKGAIILFRDFSHELRVERAKDEFISLTSHQLRTPLTSLRLFAELLQDSRTGKLNSQQKSYVDKILISTDKMLSLVADFLNISKLELGRLEVKPKPTDLAKLLDQQVEEIKPLIDEKKVKLEVHIPPKLPKLKIDSLLLAQAMHNILTNAVKYAKPKNGRVDVEVKAKGKNLIISFTDNGIGIPESARPNIFTRFFRAENAIAEEDMGSGLGLYLVKQIIEALKGEVWYESQENRGTTFYLSLPS